MNVVDTRGLSCPQPVLMVHPLLSGNEPVDVLVDNVASRENVTRSAVKNGWKVTERDEGEGIVRLELRR